MQRDKLIDVTKAIGIISIVIGHSAWNVTRFNIKIGPFVYMYHLMIFIFIAGYLFPKEKIKNNDGMYRYIGKHIYKMLILYFIYNFIFVIMHNSLIKVNAINSTLYNKTEILKNCLNGIAFRNNEKMLGAFWFIPMLLITELLFAISINIINKFNKNKYCLYIAFPVIFALLGTILCKNDVNLEYKIQISILSVPFMYVGIFTKKYWIKIEKYIFTFGWVTCAIILFIIINLNIGYIELSANKIINPFVFYPISIIGIYFCLSLAKMFNKISILRSIMCFIGQNSFHIMALHFLTIKIIDIIYSRINNINDINIISKFPNSYSNNLWIVYILIGTFLPTFLLLLIKNITECIKKGKNKYGKFAID